MSDIDDILDSAANKAEIIESLRESDAFFVCWRDSGGEWHHGWKGASYEMIGHVEMAKARWILGEAE